MGLQGLGPYRAQSVFGPLKSHEEELGLELGLELELGWTYSSGYIGDWGAKRKLASQCECG